MVVLSSGGAGGYSGNGGNEGPTTIAKLLWSVEDNHGVLDWWMADTTVAFPAGTIWWRWWFCRWNGK